jgi:hypothetical protein
MVDQFYLCTQQEEIFQILVEYIDILVVLGFEHKALGLLGR